MEAARQVALLNTNMCSLAANFADAGFTPVLDVVIPDGQQLEVYYDLLASRRLVLVNLDPGSDVCRYRNEHRPPEDQFFFDGYEGLRASMQDGFGDRGWWFDTSQISAEQTARQIISDAAALGSVKG